MKVDGKIGVGQTIMMLMLTIGITDHVTVIPLLLSKAGRDAWVSVLIVAVPFFGWAYLLYLVNTRLGGESLQSWLQRTYSPLVSRLLLAPLMLGLYMMAVAHLIDTRTWATVNFLPYTPQWFTAIVLILMCVVAACGRIAQLGYTSGVLLPIVSILGFFVMSGNLSKKDYSQLFPILQNGVGPMLEAMVYAGGGYAEMFILLLLHHHIRTPMRLRYYFLLIAILIILTLSPLTGAIAEFGPVESSRQRFPAFEQWRLLTVGRNIENMEFFAVYQWLSGSFTRLSLCLLLLAEMFNARSEARRKFLVVLLGASILLIDTLPFNDMQFMTFLSKVYYPFFLFVVASVSLVIIGLVLKTRSKQKVTGHGS
mgnify:FL=1